MEQKNFEAKVLHYIVEKRLLQEQDQVIVGCSGGADSVALLMVLQRLKEKLGIELWVMHVEHGIRGQQSKLDAAFVENLCVQNRIPFVQKNIDVPAFSECNHLGLEEAARIMRYEAFADYAHTVEGQTGQTVKIAIAHHLEDNAETILFQMMRGSGLRGMCGMHALYRKEHDYIRPLLCVSRKEIEDFLEENGQNYCVDATNTDVNYSRNCIRHEVIPKLKQINQQAVLHMNQTANRLEVVYDFLIHEADKMQPQVIVEDKNIRVQIRKLLELHPALQSELMRRALVKAAGKEKDISAVHIEELLQLIRKQSGKELHLPYQLQAKVEYEMLVFRKENLARADALDKGRIMHKYWMDATQLEMIAASGQEQILWGDETEGYITVKVVKKCDGNEQISKKTYTKQVDYDKIKKGFFIRKRQPQDYFVLDKQGHHKKFSDYLINEKVPAAVRDEIFLLAVENEIIWAIGYRLGYNYKITEETKYILEITYKKHGGLQDGLYEKA